MYEDWPLTVLDKGICKNKETKRSYCATAATPRCELLDIPAHHTATCRCSYNFTRRHSALRDILMTRLKHQSIYMSAIRDWHFEKKIDPANRKEKRLDILIEYNGYSHR